MKSRVIWLAVVLLFAGACAAGPNTLVDIPSPEGVLAGFWRGLWHGFIAPVTFLISLFTEKVSVYELHNNGGWYDAGFMFGVSIIFGGSARGAAMATPTRKQ